MNKKLGIALWIACVSILLLAVSTCYAVTTPARHTYPSEENTLRLEKHVEPTVKSGFLPVCKRAVTSEKVVAFTIDDCNQADNLNEIIALFLEYGGKATIFPIGEKVENCAEQLCYAYEKGFEIENHTMTHCGLYDVDDAELASQISMQNEAVSKALGVTLQMHFLRPRGGDNQYDQRTHAYLRQYGYYGIAHWAHVGGPIGSSVRLLKEKIEPGDILLFHTTDGDLSDLKELVPYLAKEGYSFVTLNELYGLPENEAIAYTPLVEEESLLPYTRFPQILRKEDYLHDVYLLQERLSELGYLTCAFNGYYGQATKNAVIRYQQKHGLDADGICGPKTWNALFGSD